MGEKVLVTGTSGFVGGAVGRWLRERTGANVTGLSRGAAREGACDAEIRHDLAQKLPPETPEFDAIVHCAALASPWARPSDYQRNNLTALRNIIAFAQAKPPRRFIFISSSSVHYAYADQEGITEDTPWPPRAANLYAASKREGEALVRASGLNWTIARPRAVFGPGDTVVFPRILHAAKVGALPRLVRTDGVTPRADLLYIDNLAFFIARILERDAGGAFVLTNNEPVKTPAMLDDLFARLGLPKPTKRLPVGVAMAAAGAMELISRVAQDWREPVATRFGVASLAYSKTFNIARAIAELGAPPVSLSEGMDAFVAWQKPRLA